MKEKLIKALEFIAVIADILISTVVVRNISVESILRGSRRRADVTSMVFDVLDEYAEYFIVRLPDGSYILAQMSIDDARKLKAGKEITLPVGQKCPAHRQVLANISELCEEYDVYTEGVFYCIDDKWNEEHNFMLTLVRIVIIVLTTIVIGVVLIMLIDKVFKEKEVQQG